MTAITTRADLVMPKLGLTMTEGKVARWAFARGTPFAAGDIVVVVETDKIAFDVEAPGAGTLADILVPEGVTAAVGTPIAHWIPANDVAKHKADQSEAVPPAATMTALASPAVRPVAGSRILATPYARRLARNADLDLETVTASNGRRITAADIEVALSRRTNQPSGQKSQPLTSSQATLVPASGFSFYGADICVDRVLELLDEINAANPALKPSVCHFAALAVARAIDPTEGVIALQHDDHAPRHLSTRAARRLSEIIAADRAESASSDGPIAILVRDAERSTIVGHARIDCGAVLGVGAPVFSFRPDANNKPVLRAEVTLVLTVADTSIVPNPSSLLARIRALLESPLVLLAS